MRGRILIDTGPLVCLFDRREQHYDRCLEVAKTLPGRLYTCRPVITEAAYLLDRHDSRLVDMLYAACRDDSQYADFLNAVAASDPLGLYNPNMGSSTLGGIVRSGAPGSYAYAVKPPALNAAYPYDNKPVVWVSLENAVRFTNWLHNGQPSGAEDATTTEDGAYSSVTRKSGATWFLPSEDDSSYPLTDVGAYALSPSPYGTFDQGGNVWDWNDTVVNSDGNFYFGRRGGAFSTFSDRLTASYPFYLGLSGADGGIGFRVATVPEPGTFCWRMMAVIGLLWRKIRRHKMVAVEPM